MDKTRKITLKQKIHGKWDFDKTEFQKQKTEKLWLQIQFLPVGFTKSLARVTIFIYVTCELKNTWRRRILNCGPHFLKVTLASRH